MHGSKCCGSPLDNDADKMHDGVGAIEQLRQGGAVVEGAGYKFGSLGRKSACTRDVPDQGADAVAAAQQQRGKMAAHKPGGAGNGD
jgi:hypothetical protein